MFGYCVLSVLISAANENPAPMQHSTSSCRDMVLTMVLTTGIARIIDSLNFCKMFAVQFDEVRVNISYISYLNFQG